MFEHQELSDNGNMDDNYYNDDMNDENPYSTNFNDDYYNDNTQHDEEKINDHPCYALPQSYPIFAYRGIIISLLCSYRGGS